MRLRMRQLTRRARILAMVMTAGAVFQTTTCSAQATNLLFDLGGTILNQLITSYVSDQLNVSSGSLF